MAKKKKGGKKKSSSSSKEKVEAPLEKLYKEFNEDERNLITMLESKKDWVYVEMKLVHWKWANFTAIVRTSTPLTHLATKVKLRHGRITDLRLYRNPPSEQKEIKEEEWDITLEELGVQGGPKEDKLSYILYYDFTPARSDALLLKEPNLILPEDYLPNGGGQKPSRRKSKTTREEGGTGGDGGYGDGEAGEGDAKMEEEEA